MHVRFALLAAGAWVMAVGLSAQEPTSQTSTDSEENVDVAVEEASTSLAEEAQPSEKPKPVPASAGGVENPEGITCKIKRVAGSRIPQKVCMTNFEWWDRHTTQMENRRSLTNRNSYCSEPSGAC